MYTTAHSSRSSRKAKTVRNWTAFCAILQLFWPSIVLIQTYLEASMIDIKCFKPRRSLVICAIYSLLMCVCVRVLCILCSHQLRHAISVICCVRFGWWCEMVSEVVVCWAVWRRFDKHYTTTLPRQCHAFFLLLICSFHLWEKEALPRCAFVMWSHGVGDKTGLNCHTMNERW